MSERNKTSVTGIGRLLLLIVLMASVLFLVSGCTRGWVPEDNSAARKEYQKSSEGRHFVRRGDTLYAIAFNYGLYWRDVASWNGIGPPYVIHPDQTLRLTPPPRSATVTTRAAGPGPSATEREAKTPDSPPSRKPTGAVTGSSAAIEKTAKPIPPAVAKTDPKRWMWPHEGRLLSSFKAGDPSRNGIEIAGDEGSPIRATAAGEVVYSGNGLIGYGELIIIKHSERMLSAYAHNRKRLVSEGQAVAAGEKIAEMGRDDRNRVMIHFEIRLNGTPQDPLRYLPRK